MSFQYKIVRSDKRKTIALQIKNAEVTLRIPTNTPQHYINSLIQAKTPWIMKKLTESRLYTSPPPPLYLPENSLLIFGQPRVIAISFANKADVNINDDSIHVIIPKRLACIIDKADDLAAQIKKQVHAWMKTQAISYLNKVLPQLSLQLNLYPTSHKVRLYKARWGSCNNKHELSFNYLLAMTPSWVFNYVIIHELCHIKHLNHSEKFWLLVKKHQPNYKEASLWLKENQYRLV